MSDMNWRDKDDLDLTAEDIDAMVSEGQPVDVRGPYLPSAARIQTVSQTFGGPTKTLRPGASGVRIMRPIGA